MPELKTARAIQSGIREGLNSGDYWTFVGDTEAAHVAIGRLDIAVTFDGIESPAMMYTSFEFRVIASKETTPVSLLMVPKARFTFAQVCEFVVGIGQKKPLTADTDILVITRKDPELLMIAIDSIRRGAAYALGDPGLN